MDYIGFSGIIGHEFVGTVQEINGKDRRLTGRRVVAEINCGCGVCSYCLKGLKNHCPDRKVPGIFNKDEAMPVFVMIRLA